MADKYLNADEIWALLTGKSTPQETLANETGPEESAPVGSTVTIADAGATGNQTAPSVNLWIEPGHAPFAPLPDHNQKAEVLEEVEEEEEVNPFTCRYFVPSQQSIDEGSELPETWPFNKAQNYHACTNPKFNQMGKFACEMVKNQSQCIVFSDTEPQTMKRVLLTKKVRSNMPGEVRRLSVIKARYGLSTPIYNIVAQDANMDGIIGPETEETVLHIVDGAELKDKTQEVLDALWAEVITDFGEAYQKDNMPAKPKPASYIKELVTV